MKKRILFVDDDAFLLAGLRRLLRSCRSEWDMEFVGGGEEAIKRMKEKAFDVIVSDMRMPGMDGAQLLSAVRADFPDAVRIILSGQSAQEVVFRSVGPAHQFLSKPCSGD
ncbi:MAG: response regulator, partial [Planctomycetota bacterium]